MSVAVLVPPRRLLPRLGEGWTMAAAVVGLIAVLWLLPIPLQVLPDPIGPSARQLGEGARATVTLTLASGALGLMIGVLGALGRLSKWQAVRWLAAFYIWAVRGTPLIVQILFVYFALPALLPGLRLSDYWSAVVALSINVGAYNAEIIRAGIQSVPEGQVEAAKALGLRALQILRAIVLPQALRVALPPLVNNAVALLKDSSLAYVIGVVELSLIGNSIQAESFQPVPVFITVAGIYLLLTTFLSWFSSALERRMNQSRRGH
ncbi:MAG TPA: amino acid ABC transporter permease [Xanthomonadaceae bacterium]|nr:amino acid ABC transporter permease [Xanthomonadaceae bacterium]